MSTPNLQDLKPLSTSVGSLMSRLLHFSKIWPEHIGFFKELMNNVDARELPHVVFAIDSHFSQNAQRDMSSQELKSMRQWMLEHCYKNTKRKDRDSEDIVKRKSESASNVNTLTQQQTSESLSMNDHSQYADCLSLQYLFELQNWVLESSMENHNDSMMSTGAVTQNSTAATVSQKSNNNIKPDDLSFEIFLRFCVPVELAFLFCKRFADQYEAEYESRIAMTIADIQQQQSQQGSQQKTSQTKYSPNPYRFSLVLSALTFVVAWDLRQELEDTLVGQPSILEDELLKWTTAIEVSDLTTDIQQQQNLADKVVNAFRRIDGVNFDPIRDLQKSSEVASQIFKNQLAGFDIWIGRNRNFTRTIKSKQNNIVTNTQSSASQNQVPTSTAPPPTGAPAQPPTVPIDLQATKTQPTTVTSKPTLPAPQAQEANDLLTKVLGRPSDWTADGKWKGPQPTEVLEVQKESPFAPIPSNIDQGIYQAITQTSSIPVPLPGVGSGPGFSVPDPDELLMQDWQQQFQSKGPRAPTQLQQNFNFNNTQSQQPSQLQAQAQPQQNHNAAVNTSVVVPAKGPPQQVTNKSSNKKGQKNSKKGDSEQTVTDSVKGKGKGPSALGKGDKGKGPKGNQAESQTGKSKGKGTKKSQKNKDSHTEQSDQQSNTNNDDIHNIYASEFDFSNPDAFWQSFEHGKNQNTNNQNNNSENENSGLNEIELQQKAKRQQEMEEEAKIAKQMLEFMNKDIIEQTSDGNAANLSSESNSNQQQRLSPGLGGSGSGTDSEQTVQGQQSFKSTNNVQPKPGPTTSSRAPPKDWSKMVFHKRSDNTNNKPRSSGPQPGSGTSQGGAGNSQYNKPYNNSNFNFNSNKYRDSSMTMSKPNSNHSNTTNASGGKFRRISSGKDSSNVGAAADDDDDDTARPSLKDFIGISINNLKKTQHNKTGNGNSESIEDVTGINDGENLNDNNINEDLSPHSRNNPFL